MYCRNCGEQVDDTAKFCSNCGEAIISTSEPGSGVEGIEPESVRSKEDNRNRGVHIFATVGLALVPALGAEILVLYFIFNANGVVFLISLVGFSYLLYQVEDITSMAGQTCFWLAVEVLLVPPVLFAFAIRTNESVLVSMIWIVGSAIVSVPIAGVFYLLSKRIGN